MFAVAGAGVGEVDDVGCDGEGRGRRRSCREGSFRETLSKKVRKAGLPKREPPLSSGGHSATVFSISSRISRTALTVGWRGSFDMAEMGVFLTESDSVNTNETIRV